MSRSLLFITLERRKWRKARQNAYTAQLGYEEGFRAHGFQTTTITTPWLPRARTLLRGKRFDQVWLEILHTRFPDDDFLAWVAELAPVRIGYVQESLEYSAEECAQWPALEQWTHWKDTVENRLSCLTHILTGDERDARSLSARIPALWWPQAVPERYVADAVPPVSDPTVVFVGSIYGERAALWNRPELEGRVVVRRSGEHYSRSPACFDMLHRVARVLAHPLVPAPRFFYAVYLTLLRRLRERHFRLWLATLRSGCAVLNPPQFFKCYAGRVVEGMATGRPVLAATIPRRPLARKLFTDGEEILLFRPDDQAQFADHVNRLVADRAFTTRIAEQALDCVRRHHTIEKRVGQILAWVETGREPSYR